MKVFGLQATLDGGRIQLGEVEIIECLRCSKKLIRTKGSPAFENNPRKYFYCSDCQGEVEEKIVWTQGVPIRTGGDKK